MFQDTMALCPTTPWTWEDESFIAWGKKVAALMDAAYEKTGNPYKTRFPMPPGKPFNKAQEIYYLRKAVRASWEYWSKYSPEY